MRRRLLYILAGVLFLAGAALLLLPVGEEALGTLRNRERIEEFQKETYREGQGTAEEDIELKQQMYSYNERIYAEGQSGLTDAWSYEQGDLDLQGTGMAGEMAGYLTIPAMGLELPLYIGADQENLSKGAAVLGQTSMPVGGENTNCVIAAHRGYGGTAMFREIEKLKAGDEVKITNLWETLTYEVIKCIVILPDDIDAVKIVPEEDLVTLVTCHPYTQNYQRYVVYCRRMENPSENGADDTGQAAGGKGKNEEDIVPYDGVPFRSSKAAIRKERILTAAGCALLAALFACLLVWLAVKKKGGGRQKKKTGRIKK